MTEIHDGDPGDEHDNGKPVCCICGEPIDGDDLFICLACAVEEAQQAEEADSRGNER